MRKKATVIVIIILAGFLIWRFIRPMNIFIVDERFAWPVDTLQTPALLADLSAEQCGRCHPDFYGEWQTSIHAHAWVDPYFQTDWKFDGSQHNCRLCHTPLDRQQPQKVTAYRDPDRWDPVLQENPDFDNRLQHEGVTCAACHYRDGKIVGVLGNTRAPHEVQKLKDPNQVCVRCHVVEGERWDTFFRFPPCGTVAEIRSSEKDHSAVSDNTAGLSSEGRGNSGEVSAHELSSLGCVQCHMPLLERPLVAGGEVHETRQHLWRGGHDPEMVKKALSINFNEHRITGGKAAIGKRMFSLMITNTGAAHYVPTGTPDRHLTVRFRLIDAQGKVLEEQTHTIRRTVMWRPFIVDLRDTRLQRWIPRYYAFEIEANSRAVKVEALVKYHLLDEARRKRIGYENKTPVSYEVFRKQVSLLLK